MSRRIQWSLDGTKSYTGSTSRSLRLTHAEATQLKLDAEPNVASYASYAELQSPNETYYNVLSFNFPSAVTLEKLAFWSLDVRNMTFQVSDDTDYSLVPGVNGTWTNIGSGTNVANSYWNTTTFTPTSTQWFRILSNSGNWRINVWCLHFFGDYTNRLVTLYNDDDPIPSEITSPTYFDFGAARSNSDFNESKVFRIRNNDLVPHTYSATIDAQDYSDVLFVDDHFTLSVDGGNTKLSALSTDIIQPGENSIPITLHADIPIAENPANGWYYPRVIVNTET